jgi:hypothetical protein
MCDFALLFQSGTQVEAIVAFQRLAAGERNVGLSHSNCFAMLFTRLAVIICLGLCKDHIAHGPGEMTIMECRDCGTPTSDSRLLPSASRCQPLVKRSAESPASGLRLLLAEFFGHIQRVFDEVPFQG